MNKGVHVLCALVLHNNNNMCIFYVITDNGTSVQKRHVLEPNAINYKLCIYNNCCPESDGKKGRKKNKNAKLAAKSVTGKLEILYAEDAGVISWHAHLYCKKSCFPPGAQINC